MYNVDLTGEEAQGKIFSLARPAAFEGCNPTYPRDVAPSTPITPSVHSAPSAAAPRLRLFNLSQVYIYFPLS